jgi:Flp pilus assembly protein TadG
MTAPAPRRSSARRQRGALMISYVLLFLAVLGMAGMALDLAQVYTRKTELQQLADDVAIAAAQSLDGTAAGVAAAVAAAQTNAAAHRYGFYKQMVWNPAALSFAASPDAPDGSWQSAAAAAAAPATMLFARVDTTPLDDASQQPGIVTMAFMGVLGDSLASATVRSNAVAGRAGTRVMPLAVCPLSSAPAASRTHTGAAPNVELVEFGFRRGVGYNLLDLNGSGATAVHYLLNPIDRLNALGQPANTADAVLKPFMCSGTMPVHQLNGSEVSARPGTLPFTLAAQLNSRFDQGFDSNDCQFSSAPPDRNVKSYDNANSWMTPSPAAAPQPIAPFAEPRTIAGRRVTVAEQPPATAADTANSYGPLWSYGPAVQFAAPNLPFAKSDWSKLYPVFAGGTSTGATAAYVNGLPPYNQVLSSVYQAPAANHPSLRARRVLNIPLLACPVAAGANVLAQVIGVGRFFMTAPATASMISAEFAGTVSQNQGYQVELYR